MESFMSSYPKSNALKIKLEKALIADSDQGTHGCVQEIDRTSGSLTSLGISSTLSRGSQTPAFAARSTSLANMETTRSIHQRPEDLLFNFNQRPTRVLRHGSSQSVSSASNRSQTLLTHDISRGTDSNYSTFQNNDGLNNQMSADGLTNGRFQYPRLFHQESQVVTKCEAIGNTPWDHSRATAHSKRLGISSSFWKRGWKFSGAESKKVSNQRNENSTRDDDTIKDKKKKTTAGNNSKLSRPINNRLIFSDDQSSMNWKNSVGGASSFPSFFLENHSYISCTQKSPDGQSTEKGDHLEEEVGFARDFPTSPISETDSDTTTSSDTGLEASNPTTPGTSHAPLDIPFSLPLPLLQLPLPRPTTPLQFPSFIDSETNLDIHETQNGQGEHHEQGEKEGNSITSSLSLDLKPTPSDLSSRQDEHQNHKVQPKRPRKHHRACDCACDTDYDFEDDDAGIIGFAEEVTFRRPVVVEHVPGSKVELRAILDAGPPTS